MSDLTNIGYKSSIYYLLKNKTLNWIAEEKENNQSLVYGILSHIENSSKLREPQKEAIEVYLWLKFVGKNQRLSDIVKQGLLYDESIASEYNLSNLIKDNPVVQFIYQFAVDNGLKNIENELLNAIDNKKKWEQFLEELLHNFEYTNYLYSLPMGAGKTYLMACFIYLDLYFAAILKNDKRFSHNFIVFAPSASKTAILPSLKTIENFNPEWILPKESADKLKQIIHIEILDALSSKRKDKLQGNNPNLEKVNRLSQTKDFGLVFITNAEKVVMEKYTDEDKIYVDKNGLYEGKKDEEIVKTNELRDRLSKIPNLTVILDEVHHSYGKSGDGEKKLRRAVGIINKDNNVNCVIGLSGTPYVVNKIELNEETIKLSQIQDIVYNYPLNEGIGNFLKIPDIKNVDLNTKSFVENTLTDFFNNYDIKYSNGTKSKIAFYCPNIKNLNEEILPVVQEWYSKNRENKENEIFKYYSNVKKEDQNYALPKENLSIFNNLDKPYCDKRVVLLVAVGTEGWDCKSLTSVALPRKATTKNFVLQTTCRCLREVENAENERALIYLSKENYETLDKELKSNYKLSIDDLKLTKQQKLPVNIKKPKLGKVKYTQIKTNYNLVKMEKADSKNILGNFDFEYYKKTFSYDASITKGKIGKGKITSEIKENIESNKENNEISEVNFIYSISKNLWGILTEAELYKNYSKELNSIRININNNIDWISMHPNLKLDDIIKDICSSFAERVIYETEKIKTQTEIDLLDWNIQNPEITALDESGKAYKMMPRLETINLIGNRGYLKHPEYIIDDYFGENNIDPQDISFNYVPYKMDSEFEQNALEEMLRLSELKGLEVYFNGFKDKDLQSFYIETPRGKYTPDFLILARDNKKQINKILIIETKGKTYYEEFKVKEKFIKEQFIPNNQNFAFKCFTEEGDNNFSKHLDDFKKEIKKLKGELNG